MPARLTATPGRPAAGAARKVRLLLDEMWPPAIAEALRERGHDVEAVAERRDLRGKPDEAIFEEALARGCAIVTENVVDYRPLASMGAASRTCRSDADLHEQPRLPEGKSADGRPTCGRP